jgi:hypothetical protein
VNIHKIVKIRPSACVFHSVPSKRCVVEKETVNKTDIHLEEEISENINFSGTYLGLSQI